MGRYHVCVPHMNHYYVWINDDILKWGQCVHIESQLSLNKINGIDGPQNMGFHELEELLCLHLAMKYITQSTINLLLIIGS